MTEYPLTWLADVLRAEGCRVVEEPGWATRGRPASTGTFKPRAILHHWDASAPSSHGAISTVINGTADAPGPLCSILTCRGNADHAPSVHIIAAGRTNHGGVGDGWGTIPRDDANTYAVGHEIAQTSNQPWPPDQLDQVRMAEAAILRKLFGRASNGYCAHSEYAPDRKIDTTEGSHGQDMDAERLIVQGLIDGTGDDDLKHDYVRLVTEADIDLSPGGSTITFEREEIDTGADHASGKAGITMPYRAVASGVVQVHGSGRRSCEVKRTLTDGSVASGSYDESDESWSNSPFSIIVNAGDTLRVVLSALSDTPARSSHVRIFCDIVERP